MSARMERLTYTAAEVSQMLGISQSTVIDRCRNGALPMVHGIGNRVLIPKRALHRQMPDVFGPLVGIDTDPGQVFT